MKSLSFITASILATGLGARQFAQAQVRIEVKPYETTLSMSEPVNIQLIAKNNTGMPVVIDLGFNRQRALSFDIKAPDGSVAHVSAPTRWEARK